MFCPSCGINLTRPTKFCRQCGARVNLPENTEVTPLEKRFDEYLDGLFWTAFLGLGVIIGGLMILSEGLHLSAGWLIAYGALGSLAFLIVFGLSLWQTLVMAKAMNKAVTSAVTQTADELPPARDTNKMLPAASATPVETPASITENTTRNFEPLPVKPQAE